MALGSRSIAVGTMYGKIQVWDKTTLKYRLQVDAGPGMAPPCPTGSVAAPDVSAPTSSGNPQFPAHSSSPVPVSSLASDRHGLIFSSCGEGIVRVWDEDNWTRAAGGAEGSTRGSAQLVGEGQRGGGASYDLGRGVGPASVLLSCGDGILAVATSDGSIAVWSTEMGRCLRKLEGRGHAGEPIQALAVGGVIARGAGMMCDEGGGEVGADAAPVMVTASKRYLEVWHCW
ncbi:unnamed protein product [Discosporangium mesarthrocarpum]